LKFNIIPPKVGITQIFFAMWR